MRRVISQQEEKSHARPSRFRDGLAHRPLVGRPGDRGRAAERLRGRRSRLRRRPDGQSGDPGGGCEDTFAPPRTDACAVHTTPAAGAGCVCDAADAVSNRMLLTPTTCIGPATLATPAPPVVTPQPRVSGSSPNLLIILSDDQRW